ncbi:prepilin peptidase [Streptacidiphilus sp. MAP12-16]|uniref:prepilin peptidase n=1 Tax=Streptacidiphilus sp. MAP12-16 TaxID=3156300 RepID=UPI0035193AA4
MIAGLALLVGAALVWRVGLRWDLPAYVFVLAVLGPVLMVVDLELMRLPNRIVLPAVPVLLVLLGTAALGCSDGGASLRRALLGAVAAGLCLGAVAWLLPQGLGWGDVKAVTGLLGPLAGWTCWSGLAWAGVVAFTGAALTAAVTRRAAVAMGPFLFGGVLVIVLWAGPPR